MFTKRNKSRKSKKNAAAVSAPVERESSEQLSAGLYWTLGMIRPVGYALLIFFLIDLVDVLTPLRLMNPVWEFQTIGRLVEQVPIPLIALAMIFFGEKNRRTRVELLLLKGLSVLLLVAGVIYFLFIPIAILDAVRIDRQNQSQIDTQVQQRVGQLQPLKEELEQTKTERQLEALLGNLAEEGQAPTIESREQFQDIKEELTSNIVRLETSVRNQAEETQKQQRRTLLKNSIKWNVGALISGMLFIGLWQATGWTRRQ